MVVCSGQTKQKAQCTKKVKNAGDYCHLHVHQKEDDEEVNDEEVKVKDKDDEEVKVKASSEKTPSGSGDRSKKGKGKKTCAGVLLYGGKCKYKAKENGFCCLHAPEKVEQRKIKTKEKKEKDKIKKKEKADRQRKKREEESKDKETKAEEERRAFSDRKGAKEKEEKGESKNQSSGSDSRSEQEIPNDMNAHLFCHYYKMGKKCFNKRVPGTSYCTSCAENHPCNNDGCKYPVQWPYKYCWAHFHTNPKLCLHYSAGTPYCNKPATTVTGHYCADHDPLRPSGWGNGGGWGNNGFGWNNNFGGSSSSSSTSTIRRCGITNCTNPPDGFDLVCTTHKISFTGVTSQTIAWKFNVTKTLHTEDLICLELPLNESSLNLSLVKKQYRTLALKHHPDKTTEENKQQSENKFKALNASYERLTRVLT